MSNDPTSLNRRDCLKRGLLSLVAAPIGVAAASLSAVAAEKAHAWAASGNT